MELSAMMDVLGGQRVLRMKLQNSFDLIELSDRGITKGALAHLAKNLNLTANQIAAYLPVSERTVHRKKSNDIFERNVSEHILKMAEVISYGIEVFEDREKFMGWMDCPNQAMGGKLPKELMNSMYGMQHVLDILGRIAYGVYS